MVLTAVLGLLLLILLPAEAVWRSRQKRPARARLARYRATIVKATVLLSLLWLVAFTTAVSASDLGLGSNLQTPGIVGLIIATVVSSGLIVSALLAKSPGQRVQDEAADMFKPEGWIEIGHFIVLVLLIGFAWEVLYRGFLLHWLVPIVGTPLAVLLAGLSYGLAHGWENSRKGVASIVSALLFATAFALTGSLWCLIMIHIALPTAGFLSLRRQMRKPHHDEQKNSVDLVQAADGPSA